MDRNETVFDRDTRSVVFDILQSRKIELEKTLEEMTIYHRENKESLFSDDHMEEVDRAGKEISNQAYYSLMERRSKELKRLEGLIKHIKENEEFGICEDCGEEIGYQRIMAMPDVTRCIECQRDFEKSWARDINKMRYPVNNRKPSDWDTGDSSEDLNGLALKDRINSISKKDDLEEIELEVTAKEESVKLKAPSSLINS
jgi:RNA polymerase-binding protein DksA